MQSDVLRAKTHANSISEVERGSSLAKLWLDLMRLQHSSGLNGPEIRRIQRMIAEHHSQLVEAWNAYFGS